MGGQPNGIVTAELFNWTGHVLMVPYHERTGHLESEHDGRSFKDREAGRIAAASSTDTG